MGVLVMMHTELEWKCERSKQGVGPVKFRTQATLCRSDYVPNHVILFGLQLGSPII